MQKTRIIATFGPSVASVQKLRTLLNAGANLFRINCSHGTRADFLRASRLIRRAAVGFPFPIGVLFDLSGPKLRLARFQNIFEVKAGDRFSLTTDASDLDRRKIAVNHPAIVKSLKIGHKVFIDDGNIECRVVRARATEARLEALNDGLLSSAKGINLPDSDLDLPTITRKDQADLRSAVDAGADFVALSFVRSGDDVLQLKKSIRRLGGHQKVIAKLEKREAIADLEQVLLAADGLMVARGDLGVELEYECLPGLQKKIIKLARSRLKPVIVATQMLESMRTSPRATRAEVNDVATAVYDQTDAVMLSAETATGKYPDLSVMTMARVIAATETEAPSMRVDLDTLTISEEIPLAIAEAVRKAQDYAATSLILAYTTSGFTARLIASLRPAQPVVALTPDSHTATQLLLYRGVIPLKVRQPRSFKDMLQLVERTCAKYRLARPGEKVIITGGAPFGAARLTNLLMVHKLEGK